jgi:hypothetical protein
MPKMSLVKQAESRGELAEIGGPLAVTDPDKDYQIIRRVASGAPYVQFIHPMSKENWGIAARAIPGLREYDPLLFRGKEQDPIKLAPFKFCLLKCRQFWTQRDNTGTFTHVLLAPPGKEEEDYREHFEAVILAFLPDRVVPTRCTFRSGLCPIVGKALATVEKAASPEWAGLSAEHAATVRIKQPQLRFTVMAEITQKTGERGNLYPVGKATVAPLSAGDANLLTAFTANPDAQSMVDAVLDAYLARLDEFDTLAGAKPLLAA